MIDHAAQNSTFWRLTYWLRASVAPSFSATMFNLCSLVIAVGVVGYAFLLVQLGPVISVEVLDIKPSDHIIDREKSESLSILRKVTMRRAATLQVNRQWIDEGGGVAPTLDDFITLTAGEQIRSRINIIPPTALNPGHYRYRVTLRWCNMINSCVNTQLEDIEITIRGYAPVHMGGGFQDHRF